MTKNGDDHMYLVSLPFVEYAINSAALDSTGIASFKLVLGAMPAAPVDMLDG